MSKGIIDLLIHQRNLSTFPQCSTLPITKSMKIANYILVIILLCLSSIANAQEYKVDSFEILPNDLTARTESRVDGNGRKCGVIKIYVKDDIIEVSGPAVGGVIDKGLEKRVYVSHDAKQIELYFKEHMPLRVTFDDFNFTTLSGNMTYIMKLSEVLTNNQTIQNTEVETTSNDYQGKLNNSANTPDGDQVESQLLVADVKELTKALESNLKLYSSIEVIISDNKSESIQLTYGCDKLFVTGRPNIKSDAQTDLTYLSVFMKNNPTIKAKIFVYTDNTGSLKVNKQLADNRADLISKALIECGVEKNRIYSEGKPMCDYVASNENADGRSANRRVEIELYNGSDVKADAVEYFDLKGNKLPARPTGKGVYIRVENGKAEKVTLQ